MAAGTFTDWGSTILHHVADSKPIQLLGLSITKHIIMLLIASIVTITMALLLGFNRKSAAKFSFLLVTLFERQLLNS